MICSDPRCLTCTPWERAEAGYRVTRQDIAEAARRAQKGARR